MMPKYSSKHRTRACWTDTLTVSITTIEGDRRLLLILTVYDQSLNIPVMGWVVQELTRVYPPSPRPQ